MRYRRRARWIRPPVRQAQTQQINKTIEMTNNFYSNALTPSRVAQDEEAAMRRAALAF